MNERLALWGVLLAAGMLPPEEYRQELHEAFLDAPDNADLLELEQCTRNLKETVALLRAPRPADEGRFCAMLFAHLEDYYRKTSDSASGISVQMADVWRALPEFVNPLLEPFYTLHYLGDFLPPFGSEARMRTLLEEAFALARTKGEKLHEL